MRILINLIILVAVLAYGQGNASASRVATKDSQTARSSATEFDFINRAISKLRASDACFRPPHSLSHDSILKCWSRNTSSALAAQEETYRLIERLDAIADFYPAKGVILQTKLNLLTRAGLFCEEAHLPPDEIDILTTSSVNTYEWISSLAVCARETSNADVYEQLRGALSKRVGGTRYSKSVRVALLRVWFDSFINQNSPNGDLTKVTAALNAEGVTEWKTFLVFLRSNVTKFPSFPSSVISVEALKAVKFALSAA